MAESSESHEKGARSTDQTVGIRALETNRKVRWSVCMFILTGILFIVHGVGFVYRTFFTLGFELGVDRLDGVTATELAETHPDLASYIGHVQVSFGGLMIATGFGIIALAWFGIRRGQRWAFVTALGVPLIFAVFTIPLHQTVHFDFDFLLHLGPAGVGLGFLMVGGVLGYLGFRDAMLAPSMRVPK